MLNEVFQIQFVIILSTVETPIQQEVAEVKQRYEDLLRRLQISLTDLDLAQDWVEHMNDLKANEDWVSSTEGRVDQTNPTSNEYSPLYKEIELFRPVREDVRSRRAPVTESVNGADHFLRKNRDRLTPKQRDNLQKRVDDLRNRYNGLDDKSEKDLQDAIERLRRLKDEEDDQVIILCLLCLFICLLVCSWHVWSSGKVQDS